MIIDLGLDLILIEVTAKRLSEKSLVEADAEAVRDDMRMMLIDKIKQIGRVIADVYDDPARLPQVELSMAERIWPIVVAPDGVFHNPTVWNYTNEQAGPYLAFDRKRVTATVKPVIMLDIAEVEVMFGLVAQNISLVEILEHKTQPLWIARDFKAMVSETYQHRWDGEVAYITAEQRRAFREIKRALDVHP